VGSSPLSRVDAEFKLKQVVYIRYADPNILAVYLNRVVAGCSILSGHHMQIELQLNSVSLDCDTSRAKVELCWAQKQEPSAERQHPGAKQAGVPCRAATSGLATIYVDNASSNVGQMQLFACHYLWFAGMAFAVSGTAVLYVPAAPLHRLLTAMYCDCVVGRSDSRQHHAAEQLQMH